MGEDGDEGSGATGESVSLAAAKTRNKVVALTNIKVRFDDEMVINEGDFIVGLMYSAAIDIEVSISLVDRPI